MKSFITKYFRYFSFFYEYLGNKVILLIVSSLFVGLLDGFGLALFIPVFTIAADGITEENRQALGNLDFLLDWIEKLGFGLNLNVILGVMVSLFVLKSILKFFDGILKTKLQMEFVKKLRYEMVEGLGGMSYKNFVNLDAGKIQNTLSGEVFKVTYSFLTYFSTIQFMVLLSVYVTLAMLSNFQFAILVSIGGYLSNFLFKIIFRFTEKASVGVTAFNHEFQSYLIQAVHNFKYLKATDYFAKYKLKLKAIIDSIEVQQRKIGIYNAFLSSTREPIVLIIVAVVILVQVNLMGGQMATILASLLFFYRALNYVISLQTSWQGFVAHYGGIVAAMELMEEFRSLKESTGKRPEIEQIKEIQLQNLSFEYKQDIPVLKQVNLEVERLKTLALVGGSGSGKTTMVNLIIGLLEPVSGEILINGQTRSSFDKASYRKRFGYITQEPVIFNDNIFNNVTFWDERSPENLAKFEEAIRLANINTFVNSLPEKENTKLGDNGMLVSGGQKQRISIARELYKNVDVLILDEATSALDSETERSIQENIDNLRGKYTIIIVAHRLSTVKKADKILVLDSGDIVGEGNFESLVNSSKVFKRMVELQEF
ncbi:ABC transporter ATP-binding protein [Algoriphagus sp. NF]|uniref:ABC transporter ATP-binding protein n=1 Tax=Algoriphagus TaxID=246875 RepID=UPI000479333A|nr:MULTISPECIES: ABC transporter ATP-binding protein [Algoriphagus]MCR9081079.1 ABC transporter ATP-binding protein/permease [Cyclobacteriaceae bacterium]MDE0558572.1 ABC transporter ATP-binding protein [Algoriphagus sp. NF]